MGSDVSRWFRCYAGLARDEKMVRVAIKAKQPIERVIWVWIAILESAAEVNDDGRYDFDAEEAAYFLRAEDGDILSILAGLEQSGRINDGRVRKWGERQFKSDTSAERQRRYRDNKKLNCDGQDNASSDGRVTSHNVTTPSPSRSCDAPDTDTETNISSNEDITRKRSIALDVSQKFERFYAVYPKRTNRKPAILKFCAAVKSGVDPEHIISAAARFAEAHRLAGTDKQYIPAPDVWLNKGRYDDEDLPAPVARAGPSTDERSGVAKLLAEAYGIDQRDGTQAQGDPSGFRQIPVIDGGERIENYGDDGGVFGRLLVGDGG